nr:ABC transporter permease [Micromonospora sp. DSM 115978]
ENWSGSEGIGDRILEHLALTGISVGAACALALPLGIWLGHLGRGGTVAVNVSNVGRAVPTFAVLVLLAVGPLGIGDTATVVSLFLFALAPLLTNAYVGVSEVDAGAREAARGMGMSGGQLLRRVELPLAAGVVMLGVRLASVQVVATATIAALVGGGGLGRSVVDGLARSDEPQVVGGAVLVAGLALLVDGALLAVQKLVSPKTRTRAGRSRRLPILSVEKPSIQNADPLANTSKR